MASAAAAQMGMIRHSAMLTNGVERAAHGTPPELLETVPLDYRGERVGELVVGVRSGQRRLSTADRTVLELLAAPLALATHASALSEAVQRRAAVTERARITWPAGSSHSPSYPRRRGA